MVSIIEIKNNSRKRRIKIILLIIAVLFFFSPFFITYSNEINKLFFTLPYIHPGDEPHYLAMTSSIIKDFDLEVKNNYENAVAGKGDTGFKYRYERISRHAILVDGKTNIRYNLDDIYNLSGSGFSLNGESPTIRDDLENTDTANLKERPTRYIGLPFFSSIFLWPFRNSLNLDSIAILLSAIVSLIGFYFLYLVLIHFKNNENKVLFITIIFIFTTQLWFYSKTFYPDPYIASFLIISYYFFIVKNKVAISGILLGLAFLMKYNMIIFPAIFALYLLKNKRFKKFFLFSLTIGIFAFLLLIYNFIMWGNLLFSHLHFMYGNIISGILGLLFSLDHGLIIFTPLLIFSFFGFYQFYKQKKDEAIFTFILFFTYLLIMSAFLEWHGGFSYATRHLIPIMPLLSIPLLFWYDSNRSKSLKMIFFILVIISFIFSLYSVFADQSYVLDKPPLFPYIKF
ncbi:glycosyltransferase family 39 protein [Candidatus Woesearchaeota archaeon]|nr:glycosyltransferase family 39 protein [Candidatus Woesearchaeota archaeon]